MKIEIGKTYPSRDGLNEIKVLDILDNDELPIIAVVTRLADKVRYCVFLRSDGSNYCCTESPLDIVEPPPPRINREVWLNVYARHVELHYSKHVADNICNPDRIALVHLVIDCEHGEGLDGVERERAIQLATGT